MTAVSMERKVPLRKFKFRGPLSLSLALFLDEKAFFTSRTILEIQEFTLLMRMISCITSNAAKLGNILIRGGWGGREVR